MGLGNLKGSFKRDLQGFYKGGSWDSVSRVVSTLTGLIRNFKYSYLFQSLSYYVP